MIAINITILFGGQSSEREVSLKSGRRIYEALLQAGHKVSAIDFDGRTDAAMLSRLSNADVVFLALHGGEGEGGGLQAALEQAGITHYTGSDAASAALAMNKSEAKQAVKRAGVPVTSDTIWLPQAVRPKISLPAVIKPLSGGSSVGLCIAKSKEDIEALSPTEPMLIEPLLTGREYTVGVLAGQVLPVVEICPLGGVYDYRRKYTPGETKEICPAPVSAQKAAELQALAMHAFKALGLRDFARMDFKEDTAGIPYFLEANTIPGMTETSLLPLAAATAGIDFSALCTQMALLAAARKKA